MRLPDWVIPGPAVFFCAACALVQSPAERARVMAEAAGLVAIDLADERLRAFARPARVEHPVSPVTIYVESDGAPWRVPNEPPRDPTPRDPLVLRMMLTDPSPLLAYLGRPCQYLDEQALGRCDPVLWRRGRFMDETVAAMSLAVDRIKRFYAATEVNLVGYSGGGAMAALIAARRSDVRCLVTIAAPLDTKAWTAALGVSALTASLNPADSAAALAKVRQTHFMGGSDRLVPPATTKRFLDQAARATVIHKEDFDHQCCWDEQWPSLRIDSCLSR